MFWSLWRLSLGARGRPHPQKDRRDRRTDGIIEQFGSTANPSSPSPGARNSAAGRPNFGRLRFKKMGHPGRLFADRVMTAEAENSLFPAQRALGRGDAAVEALVGSNRLAQGTRETFEAAFHDVVAVLAIEIFDVQANA